jgi:tetratricopeptide (TPR) repeat protein
MNSDISRFSDGFQRLYCDPALFDSFSAFHPISFARVLPFQAEDPVVDYPNLIAAEEAHLANRNDRTRQAVVEAYSQCGLLQEVEAANLIAAIDFFGTDFFELMGLAYANAGIFICALRWYREFIAELESNPRSGLDNESIYASIGYCLYSLGLFDEAIAWTKSCIGPRLITDVVCEALMDYEAQMTGGSLRAIERAGPRTRFTASTTDPAQAIQATHRIKSALKKYAPFQDFYIDWVKHETPLPAVRSEDYPFRLERDASSLPRHKLNLIFATCGQADALIESGYTSEAKRLLLEAATVEPAASFLWDRINALP